MHPRLHISTLFVYGTSSKNSGARNVGVPVNVLLWLSATQETPKSPK